MQNEMNEKADNQGFLQVEPTELDDTALLYVAAGRMAEPRTDCICHKQCATNDC